MLSNVKFTQFSDANQVPRMHNRKKCEFYFTWNNFFFTPSDEVRLPFLVVVVVVFITSTCTVNGGHWMPPGGLQAYSLPQPWLCRVPKVRKGEEGGACVSMETYNIKIHNREHRFPSSDPILS